MRSSRKWERIIPAYAGSTRLRGEAHNRRPDHPRIRGEHTYGAKKIVLRRGSSPHTRGAREHDVLFSARLGIIPAYAGSTVTSGGFSFTWWDHPRIRGEHPSLRRTAPSPRGSSPHTRGAPERRPCGRLRPGIIPAYAGSTLGNPCNTKDRRRDYTSFPLPVTHPSGGGGS